MIMGGKARKKVEQPQPYARILVRPQYEAYPAIEAELPQCSFYEVSWVRDGRLHLTGDFSINYSEPYHEDDWEDLVCLYAGQTGPLKVDKDFNVSVWLQIGELEESIKLLNAEGYYTFVLGPDWIVPSALRGLWRGQR